MTYHADYSPERRAHALRAIRSAVRKPEWRSLSAGARQMYAASMLICDDHGRVSQAALTAALLDPSVLQAADRLIAEATK